MNRKKKNVISIPIELVELEDHSYHILLPVVIDEFAGDMIVDTGASVTVADRKLFEEKMTLEDTVHFQSGSVTGDISEVQVVSVSKFSLGPLEIQDFQLAVIDLGYVNEMYIQHVQRKIIGLLGSDFCKNYGVIIDYAALTLTITKTEA